MPDLVDDPEWWDAESGWDAEDSSHYGDEWGDSDWQDADWDAASWDEASEESEGPPPASEDALESYVRKKGKGKGKQRKKPTKSLSRSSSFDSSSHDEFACEVCGGSHDTDN